MSSTSTLEAIPRFEIITTNERTAFKLGLVAGAGGGLIAYYNMPDSAATNNQQQAMFNGLIHNDVEDLSKLAHDPQRPSVIQSEHNIVQSLAKHETAVSGLAGIKPSPHHGTASEIGMALEGALVGGLLLVAFTSLVRNVAYRHYKKHTAQAMSKEMHGYLDALPEGGEEPSQKTD